MTFRISDTGVTFYLGGVRETYQSAGWRET